MIFYFYLLINLISIFLFKIIIHALKAYYWSNYIQIYEKLQNINNFGNEFNKIIEQNVFNVEKICHKRYYSEIWYHIDKDNSVDFFFKSKKKNVYLSSHFKINLKFKGEFKFYKCIYKKNVFKKTLSLKSYFLSNKY